MWDQRRCGISFIIFYTTYNNVRHLITGAAKLQVFALFNGFRSFRFVRFTVVSLSVLSHLTQLVTSSMTSINHNTAAKLYNGNIITYKRISKILAICWSQCHVFNFTLLPHQIVHGYSSLIAQRKN